MEKKDLTNNQLIRNKGWKVYLLATAIVMLMLTTSSWALVGSIVYDPKVEAVGIKKLLEMQAYNKFFGEIHARWNRQITEIKGKIVNLEKFNIPLEKLGWSQQDKINNGLKAVQTIQLAVEGRLQSEDLRKLRSSFEEVYGEAGNNTAVEATYQQMAKTSAGLGEIEQQIGVLEVEARADETRLKSGELSEAETQRYEAIMVARQQQIEVLKTKRDNLATGLTLSQTALMASESNDRYQTQLKDQERRREMLKAASVGLALKRASSGGGD
jgi:hypothetical protein